MVTKETVLNQSISEGINLYEIGKYEDTIQVLDDVISRTNKDKDAYHYRGLAKYRLNQHDEAIEDFNKAIDIDPEYDKVYVDRSIARIARGDYKADREDYKTAIEDCNEAIRINSHNSNAFVVRALAKIKLGVNSGVEDLTKVIDLYLRSLSDR